MWWEISDHLEVIRHTLYISNHSTIELANKYGTPLYVINANRVKENYQRVFNSVQKHLKRKLQIHFAMKANSTLSVLNLLKNLGSNIDAVSPFEVLAAGKVGFWKERILFTGTSVSVEDMEIVLGKAMMNIDSIGQLDRYASLRKMRNFDPKVSIRINPGKGAGHVPECITAGEDAKYGIPENQALEVYRKAIELGLNPVGIHQHIGSGILPPYISMFFDASEKLLDIAGKIHEELGIDFEFIDLGGGIGIPYKEIDRSVDIKIFSKELSEIVESKAEEGDLGNFSLKLEPGRFIVGDSEILLMTIVDVSDKYIPELGVNGGFNVFCRPAMYKTYHEILIANKADLRPEKKYRVSGNLCESGDVFTENKHALRKLPKTEVGDVLAILSAGAYGMTMASNYNMRSRAREIMIEDGKIKIIREKEEFEDLIRGQKF